MAYRTITREALYEEVWSKPMMRLAKDFGLSDVGLAKICKRHNIPRPTRGYWARLEAGQKPEKAPLPPTKRVEEIRINLPKEATMDKPALPDEVARLIEAEKQGESKIMVSDNLRGAHRLVVTAHDELSSASSDYTGLLRCRDEETLAITVSKEQLRRALLIFDAILKACEQRGYRVEAGPVVTMLGQSISFGIKETVSLKREQPSDVDLSGPYRFGFNRFESRRVPSGKLTLFIKETDQSWANYRVKAWSDGVKKRLEANLNVIFAGMLEIAARKREKEIELERQRIEWQKGAKQREKEARRIATLKAEQAKERARLAELLEQAECFRQSRDVRYLVEAVLKTAGSNNEEVVAWAKWALMHADRIDPTIKSPHCVLDEEVPAEPRRW